MATNRQMVRESGQAIKNEGEVDEWLTYYCPINLTLSLWSIDGLS